VILLCKLAGALGGAAPADVLLGLAARHPAARLRVAALEALVELGASDEVRALSDRDDHPLVRALRTRL
jgi:hypothetical protein